MTTRVYFIRHAEPNYENHNDFLRELTTKGLQDSQKLVNLFDKIAIDAFFSSPYKRSIDTISPLANSRHKEITTVTDFRERKITDIWIEDFAGFTEKQWADFSYKLDGGESLSQVQTRNITALEILLQEYSEKTIIIGTHGTALSTIINYYDPSFGYNEFQKIKHIFPWCVKMEFDNLAHLSTQEIPWL
ncbi:histidine phosphatase family protein [Streptococcus gallolyticus]|uniref:histidine phosphatase family protein n=1 Tax=Streptococcus hepaticus TaxID=3349163 RepID=UPI001C9616DC|nr:histidine phosphatase family protein [Streptococcus gallolyticus]MBY5040780.1 histidine phosphatase family protein [Streptococcus gallolyticus]